MFEMLEEETPRSSWRKTIEGDGGHCPICDRWGKIYSRTINQTMAKSFIWLVKAHQALPPEENGWVNIPKDAPRWLVRSNQLPTLAWWKLVQRKPKNDLDSAEEDSLSKNKFSGLWKPTEEGLLFYSGKQTAPIKVWTYNNKVQSVSQERFFLWECFDHYFDYKETMELNYEDEK